MIYGHSTGSVNNIPLSATFALKQLPLGEVIITPYHASFKYTSPFRKFEIGSLSQIGV